jgi:hypothetical protein
VVPLHDEPRPQLWVVGACVQAPEPLQVPVFPQGGLAGQSPCGSVVPLVTLVQVPVLLAQLWQVAQLALPQHVPSTQLPLMHWLPVLQPKPFGLRPQLLGGDPPRQVLGERQSALFWQVFLQTLLVVSQRYAPQLCVVGAAQLPLPLQ